MIDEEQSLTCEILLTTDPPFPMMEPMAPTGMTSWIMFIAEDGGPDRCMRYACRKIVIICHNEQCRGPPLGQASVT